MLVSAAEIVSALIAWTPRLADGFVWNLIISAVAMLVGTVLGAGLALLRLRRSPRVRWIGVALTDLTRNVPTFVFLYYLAFLIPTEFEAFGSQYVFPAWLKAALALSIAVVGFTSDSLHTAMREWRGGRPCRKPALHPELDLLLRDRAHGLQHGLDHRRGRDRLPVQHDHRCRRPHGADALDLPLRHDLVLRRELPGHSAHEPDQGTHAGAARARGRGMTGLMLRAILTLLLLIPASAASAETVLERIARTGDFNAGTRADSRPFGFRTGSGELAGFAVDLLNEIRGGLETEQTRPVALRLTEVTPANRLDLVAQHRIDIECGITTATWAREQTVDFSIPFFENGTRVLAPRSQFRSLDDLAGRRVGVVRSSTTVDVVRQYLPSIEPVDIADMDEGFRLLTGGTLDGLANIGIVLRSRLETSALKSRLVLLPRTGALAWESIGCMLPAVRFVMARLRQRGDRRSPCRGYGLSWPLGRHLQSLVRPSGRALTTRWTARWRSAWPADHSGCADPIWRIPSLVPLAMRGPVSGHVPRAAEGEPGAGMTLRGRLLLLSSLLVASCVLLAGAVLGYVTWHALVGRAREEALLAARLIARIAAIAEQVPDEVEAIVGETLVTEAYLVAQLADMARRSGLPPRELSMRLADVAARTDLDETWVTGPDGRPCRLLAGRGRCHHRRGRSYAGRAGTEGRRQRPLRHDHGCRQARARQGRDEVCGRASARRRWHRARWPQLRADRRACQRLGAKSTLDLILAGRNLDGLWVTDETMRVIAEATSTAAEPDLELAQRAMAAAETFSSAREGRPAAAAPIFDRDGVPSGATIVSLPTDELRTALKSFAASAAAITFVVLALGFALARVVARHIGEPITTIAHAAADVEGSRIVPAYLDKVTARSDEIGHLARVFRAMAIDVLGREAELDGLVRARTRELREKNEALEEAQRQMEVELGAAQALQAAILPHRLSPSTDMLHAYMMPARHMGGDFYDVFRIDEHRFALLIADVAGKGVPAAFFMAISRTVLRNYGREGRALATASCAPTRSSAAPTRWSCLSPSSMRCSTSARASWPMPMAGTSIPIWSMPRVGAVERLPGLAAWRWVCWRKHPTPSAAPG